MPDTGDPFDDLVANLNISEPDDVLDVTSLSNRDLIQRYNAVRRELTDMNEPIHALTAHGRELHSERGALRIELAKRGLL